ncbi:MAG: right-handed parallel beta-helix repeat-containing protein [Planctomycetes bacterium]|nr:right-handed parallel beta-helix repeat-containing protein [Planctomycetota bacterium]
MTGRGLTTFGACFVMLALVGCGGMASAPNRYYVDISAVAGGAGSEAQPWTDVQAAIDKLRPGDVLIVRGTKTGQPRKYPAIAISKGKAAAGVKGGRITIRGAEGENAEFGGTKNRPALLVEQPYWTIENLVFNGNRVGNDVVNLRSSFTLLRHCEIYNGREDGVDVEDWRGDDDVGEGGPAVTAEGNVMEYLTIHDCANNGDAHGIVIGKSDRNIIRYCNIYNVTGDSVQIAPESRTGHVIENNYFHITPDYTGRYENAVDIKPARNIIVRNNVFEGFLNSQGAFRIGPGRLPGANQNIRVEGNTFLNCRRGIRSYDKGDCYPRGITLIRNLFLFDLKDHPRHKRMDFAVRFAGRQDRSCDYVVVNNTIVNALSAWPSRRGRQYDFKNLVFKNNLLFKVESPHPAPRGTGATFDHNGYFASGVPKGDTAPVIGDDPLFTDPAARDYTLKAASPAIDAGVKHASDRSSVTGRAVDLGYIESGLAHPSVDPGRCGRGKEPKPKQ